MTTVYSNNGEMYWDTLEEALEDVELEVGERLTIWEGQKLPYNPLKLDMAYCLLEMITENTFEDLGEDTAQQWCERVDACSTEDLQKALERVVGAWMEEKGLEGTLYMVAKPVVEKELVVTEDGHEFLGEG